MKNNWIIATIRLNWANMVINRKAFLMMSTAMALQSLIYFSMWVIIFSQISSLKGWGLKEVAFIYGGAAIGYGCFFCFFGGINRMADAIQNGSMDIHLARPRSPLLLAALERMRADSLGDIVTGIVILTVFVHPPLSFAPLLLSLSLSAGLVFASFRLILHSLAFWSMSSEAAENGFIAFLIAGTNPQRGFGPYMKLALLTIFPAGYIGLLPVEIIRNFHWDFFAAQIGGATILFTFALWFFHYGLRRYTSGNQFIVLR